MTLKHNAVMPAKAAIQFTFLDFGVCRADDVRPKETLKNLLVSSTSSGGGTLSCDGNDEEQADEPKIAVDDRLL